jgi:hypothetical protein
MHRGHQNAPLPSNDPVGNDVLLFAAEKISSTPILSGFRLAKFRGVIP